MRLGRRRGWGLLKWAGASLCTLLLAGLLASLRYRYVGANLGSWDIGVSGGAVYALRLDDLRLPTAYSWPTYKLGAFSLDSDFLETWSKSAAWPEFTSPLMFGTGGMGSIPIWMLLVVAGAPTVWLWWRDRRRARPNDCQHCGYDLTGNVSGRCPECGVDVERPPGAVMGEETRSIE